MSRFKLFLEALEDTNSDKNVSLEKYNDLVNEYNKNKNNLRKFLKIDKEQREEKAKEVIDGNRYLGLHWKMLKTEMGIDEIAERLKGDELSEDEKRELQDKQNEVKKKVQEIDKEIKEKLRDDLREIESM